MGTPMSQDHDWDEPLSRRDYFEDDFENLALAHKPHGPSGAVTAVGIVTIIMGALGLLFCGCFSLGGAFALIAHDGVGQGGGMARGEELFMILFVCLALVVSFWSIGLLVSGIGVLARSAWARTLALVLAGFGLLFGAICIVFMMIIAATATLPQDRAAGIFLFISL